MKGKCKLVDTIALTSDVPKMEFILRKNSQFEYEHIDNEFIVSRKDFKLNLQYDDFEKLFKII